MPTVNYQGTLTTDVNNPGFDILGNKLRSREQSLNLDGIGFAEIADSANLDVNDFTFDGWAKYEYVNNGNGLNTLYSHGSGASTSGTFSINTLDNGVVRAYVSGLAINSLLVLTKGEWFYFALTREGSDVKFYINEEAPISATQSGTINNNSSKKVGKDNQSTRNYNELISDLRFYGRALNSTEIGNQYNVGKPSHK